MTPTPEDTLREHIKYVRSMPSYLRSEGEWAMVNAMLATLELAVIGQLAVAEYQNATPEARTALADACYAYVDKVRDQAVTHRNAFTKAQG